MAASFIFHLVVVELRTGECTFDFHSKLNLCMATFYESGESSVKVKAAFDSIRYLSTFGLQLALFVLSKIVDRVLILNVF